MALEHMLSTLPQTVSKLLKILLFGKLSLEGFQLVKILLCFSRAERGPTFVHLLPTDCQLSQRVLASVETRVLSMHLHFKHQTGSHTALFETRKRQGGAAISKSPRPPFCACFGSGRCCGCAVLLAVPAWVAHLGALFPFSHHLIIWQMVILSYFSCL